MLSTIYLTPYDKELEKRGHKFVRYADDCNIFTKSKYSCRRVKDSVVRFLENKMKLKVNVEKTEARRAVGSSFLGFTFITSTSREGLGYCRPKEKKISKFEEKIREITARNRGVSFFVIIRELNAYIRGWISYYARSNIKSYILKKAGQIRVRLRTYLWKIWKKPKNRRHQLKLLGIPEWRLNKIECYSSNRWCKMGKYLSSYITNDILESKFGLINIEQTYVALHKERRKLDRTYNAQLELIFD